MAAGNFAPPTPLGRLAAEKFLAAPHRTAHTGTHNGGGLYSSLLGGCLVFIEAEPHFGVKIILCLNSQSHNKQDEPNTPAYRNPARYL